MKKKIYFILLIFFICPVFAGEIFDKSFEKLSKQDKAVIENVNDYFNSVESFKSEFMQFNNADSTVAEGNFYMQKPNLLRFEYTYPFKTLLILNGSIIHYYDVELDEVTTLSKSVNPVFDLLSKQQNLAELDSKILGVKNENQKYYINTELNITNKDEADKYNVVYIFNNNIDVLEGLKLNNGNGVIELKFSKTGKNIKISKDKFIFKNPRLYKNRRK